MTIPKECEDIVNELKQSNVKNITVKILEPFNVCVIEFWDKKAYYNIQPLKSGVLPLSLYKSKIYYNPETKEADVEIVLYPRLGITTLELPTKSKVDLYVAYNKKLERIVLRAYGVSKEDAIEIARNVDK